jgi:hypothetical protein
MSLIEKVEQITGLKYTSNEVKNISEEQNKTNKNSSIISIIPSIDQDQSIKYTSN